MATADAAVGRETDARTSSPSSVDRSHRAVMIVGIALIRMADVVVTWFGLRVGLVEANPVGATVMDAIGALPGMIVVSVGVVFVIVVAVEGSVEFLRSGSSVDVDHLRGVFPGVCYGTVALTWSCVVAYNVYLIVLVS
jgi:hypothetical protein